MAALSHQMDIYGAWIHLARTRAEWRGLKRSKDLDLPQINSLGLTVRLHMSTGDLHFALFVDREKLGDAGLVEICAHEAAHFASLLHETIGSEITGEDEPFAYLVGWASAWLWKGCQ